MKTSVIIVLIAIAVLLIGSTAAYFWFGFNAPAATEALDKKTAEYDCPDPVFTENDKNFSAASKICLQTTQGAAKPVRILYKFAANKDAPYSQAVITLPDGIALSGGSLERIGSIAKNNADAIDIAIVAKKAGYYRIAGNFTAKDGNVIAASSDYIDIEAGEDGSVTKKTAPNNWGEMDQAIPANRDNGNIESALAASGTMVLNKEFSVVYGFTSPADISNATVSMYVPRGLEVMSATMSNGDKVDTRRLVWSGSVKKNQKVEMTLAVVAAREGEGDIYGHFLGGGSGPIGGVSDVEIIHVRVDKYGGTAENNATQ